MCSPQNPIPELLCSNVAFLGESTSFSWRFFSASPDTPLSNPHGTATPPTSTTPSPSSSLWPPWACRMVLQGRQHECVTLFHALAGVRLAASPPPPPWHPVLSSQGLPRPCSRRAISDWVSAQALLLGASLLPPLPFLQTRSSVWNGPLHSCDYLTSVCVSLHSKLPGKRDNAHLCLSLHPQCMVHSSHSITTCWTNESKFLTILFTILLQELPP